MKERRGKAEARRVGQSSGFSLTFSPTLATLAPKGILFGFAKVFRIETSRPDRTVAAEGVSEKHNITHYPYQVPNKSLHNKRGTKVQH